MSQAGIKQVEVWIKEGKLSEEAAARVVHWLVQPAYADFRAEILDLIEDEHLIELEDAFRKQIEFGTGGIRGKMGPGPNRINLRTVGEAAQGLARYILKAGGPNGAGRGAVIAHDTRHNSNRFARQTAAILAGNGVFAHLFNGFRATPELSFAVRETGAVAGVVISASHNPPSDNGFKAYWSDGGQVVPPHDRNIMDQVQAVTTIKTCDFDAAVKAGLIRIVDAEIDIPYHNKLAGLTLSGERDVRILYTPLHGVGATSVVPALKKLGYRDLHLIEAQAVPDGDFPTVRGGIANPEDPRVFTLAIRKAAEIDADIVIASDPDADRLGCALPHPEKGWDAPPESLALNGNQIGALLCHYMLQQKRDRDDLPPRGLVAKTIVTTDLTGLIARAFGVEVVDNLLVGFKYIGEVIEKHASNAEFIFGAEESHGYLAGSFVRDKDAAAAAVLLSACAARLKARGRTLRDYLDDIYREYGYFREIQKSAVREGAEGSREIARIMEGLRTCPPAEIGGHPIVEIIDRQTGQAHTLHTGATRRVEGAKGNVIAFTFTRAGYTRVTARPSGTEPKIKYYVSAASADHPHLASKDLEQTKAAVDRLARQILNGMLSTAQAALETST